MQREVSRHLLDATPPDDLLRRARGLFSARTQPDGSILAHKVSSLLTTLRQSPEFQFAALALHDRSRGTAVIVSQSGEPQSLQEIPLPKTSSDTSSASTQVIEIQNTATESRFTQIAELMHSKGLKSLSVLPVSTERHEHGILVLARNASGEFSREDGLRANQTAEQIALLLENSLLNDQLRKQTLHLSTIFDVNAALASTFDTQKILEQVAGFVRNVVHQDFTCLAICDTSGETMNVRVVDSEGAVRTALCDSSAPVNDCPAGLAHQRGEPMSFTHAELQTFQSASTQNLLAEGVRAVRYLPLLSRGKKLGALGLASMRDDAGMGDDDTRFLTQIASQVVIALENAKTRDQFARSKEKLTKEKLYLEEEISASHNFGEVVGDSAALCQVLREVEIAAPSNATVLVLGETGTGKELIARAVHRLSSRSQGNFIKLNCAAIPTGLLESELFGHEKGAFTGAISQKLGRIELADKGTLFLDEIGEIPMELQPKLLRVLQDQEFERLGGVKTIKVNVRLVAATNRDLAQAVNDKEFRSDLYYRLNVFPIRVPPLRERAGDIPLLVKYFVQKFARRMGKRVENIPDEVMREFEEWHWPGNIRELENFVERSVILTQGAAFYAPITELRVSSPDRGTRLGTTLEEVEREYILRTLRATGGVIAGASGAAARLGMKRTTLQSRIQKLEISREEYQD